jgi:D-3-phosphoglycerate dehydrogenase
VSIVLVGPGVDDNIVRLLHGPDLRNLLRDVESEIGEVHLSSATTVTASDFADQLSEADALLLLGKLDSTVMRKAARLRFVSVAATGHEYYIDGELAHKQSIRIAFVPAYGVDAVAEHALALALAASKNLLPSHRAVIRGDWPQPVSLQLAGSTAGVVGLGPIGRRMVDLLEGLGAQVLVWTHNPRADRLSGTAATYADLEEIFTRADLVSLHVSHTAQSNAMISDALLGLARPGMVLVNTARAGLIEPGLLERHVQQGRIRGAVDVLDEEPPPLELRRTLPDDLLVSPHVGYNTAPALTELIAGALTNLVLYARGRPLQNEVHVD